MIEVNVRSISEKVKGQGVDSAFKEHVKILSSSDKIRVFVNSKKIHDILHVHTLDLESSRFMRKYRKHGKKVVVSVHVVPESIEGSLKLPKLAKKIFYSYMLNFYKRADRCVVVNPYFKEELVNLGLDEEKIVFIPNVVASEKFSPVTHEEKLKLRKELNLPLNGFIVVGSGQIQRRKGIDDFVETAERLKDVFFVWLGGFSFGRLMDGYERYKKIVENPPNNLLFTGIVSREEVARYLKASDLFFLPSFHELFPMAVLEAVNCGLPILLRELDIYEEIYFDNYLSGNDTNEFVKRIETLRSNPREYDEWVKRSRKLARIYSPEETLKRWEKLYLDLL